MPKYKLKSQNIALIKVDETTLFFHSEKLHIYPLKDRELVDFLYFFRENGYYRTKTRYSISKFNEIYNFITSTIAKRNDTLIQNESIDRNINNLVAIVLPIAAACNLACPYCFAQTGNGFNFKSFSKTDAEKVIDFVMEQNTNMESEITFIFFGGEPLMNFDVMQHSVTYIEDKYRDRKVGYSITTNGTIINDKIIKFIKDKKVAVLLSIDGPDNEFNLRTFKNGEKSYNEVLKNISAIRAAGVPLSLRATFVSNNPYLVETYDFFENLKIPFNIVPAYNSENKSHSELTSYDEMTIQLLSKQFDDLFEYYKKKIVRKEEIYITTLKEISDIINYRIVKSIPCGAGINYYTIMSDGNIYSCPHLMNDHNYMIGNIQDGITNKESFTPVQINELKDCSSCWVKFLCLGSCLSQKISAGRTNRQTLDVNSCELEKIKWEFYLKLYYQIMKVSPEYFLKQ